MVTINPADCPSGLVYMGTVNGRREVMRRLPGRELPWETFANVHVDASISDLVPLVEARPVARDDLAIENRVAAMLSETVEVSWHKRAALILDAVVEHLNGRGGLGIDTREPLERALRDREAAVARAERAEARVRQIESRPWTIALDDKASPVMLPAVTRDEIATVLERTDSDTSHGDEVTYTDMADAVLALVSNLCDNPAVYVMRESDLPTDVNRSDDGRWFVGDEYAGHENSAPHGKRSQRNMALALAAKHEAVARAIEAEQAEDPVAELAGQIEAAAREAIRQVCDALTTATVPGLDAGVVEEMLDITSESRRIARRMLGQEASSDE